MHQVLFIFACLLVNILNPGVHNGESKEAWSTHQLFEYYTLWLLRQLLKGNVSLDNVLNMRQCGKSIGCPRKTSRVKISSSQNSLWVILVIIISELLSSQHIPPVNHQNWRTPWISNCGNLGSNYGSFSFLVDRIIENFFDISCKSHKSSSLRSEIGNFWSCFDVLLTKNSHFGSSKIFLLCKVLLGHLVMFIFAFLNL